MREVTKIVALGLAALILTGCPLVEQGAREYFPNAFTFYPHRAILQVETCVGNVSPKLGREAMDQFVRGPRGKELLSVLRGQGQRYFILGFNDFNVIWDTHDGSYMVVDQRGYGQWWISRIGRVQPAPPPRSCSPIFPR